MFLKDKTLVQCAEEQAEYAVRQLLKEGLNPSSVGVLLDNIQEHIRVAYVAGANARYMSMVTNREPVKGKSVH